MKNPFQTVSTLLRRRPGRWLLLALLALLGTAAQAQAPCPISVTGAGFPFPPGGTPGIAQSFTPACTGKLTTLVVTYDNLADDFRGSGDFVEWSIRDAAGTTVLASVAPTDDVYPNQTRTYDFSAANVTLTAGTQYRWDARNDNSSGNGNGVILLRYTTASVYAGGQAFVGGTANPTRDFVSWTVNNAAIVVPTLTSLNPNSGPVMTNVTLTGTGFTATSTVNFGSTTAVNVTFISATELQAEVPAGATTGNVTVTTPGSGTSNGQLFTVTTPPTLASLNPTSGPVGTSVTLTGTNFTAGSTVAFGSTPATSVTFNSATSLTVLVPAGAMPSLVTVTTAAGTSNGIGFDVQTPPAVTTAIPTALTTSGATLGGTVTDDGGLAVTERGVVYVLGTGTPTTANTKVIIGSGTGPFAQAITGLSAGTQYTVRAYALNSLGTSFGVNRTFTTTAAANQAPVIAAQTRSVAENTATGTNVGAPVAASDPDAGQTLSYAITGGNAAGKFAINSSSGQITVAGALDFEGTNSYPLTVQATDNATTPASTSATVTVSVTDVNEAPTALALSNASVAENAGANAAVGTFSTTDPDAGDTFTYSLVAGAGSTDNSSFNISGNALRLTASADFETKNSYAIRVRTTDQGGLTFERTFTIAITDVPAPTLSTLNPTSGPVGTVVTLTGTNFTGATSVSFGAAAATPTATSATSATATVPAGATSGNVTITTGEGTSTGVAFAVTSTATTATVSTNFPGGVTATSATLGGNVTATGGAAVTERGVVYVPGTGTPTTANTKVIIGSGTGAYSQAVTGLSASTQYTLRAYAINSAGTSYGAARSFTTLAAAPAIAGAANTTVARGGLVALSGTGLAGATSVTFANASFGNTTLTAFTSNTATALAFALPVAAPAVPVAYNVTVTTPNGTSAPFVLTLTTDITWTGATSTTWATATNWSPPAVPNQYLLTYIAPAANQPTVTGTQQVEVLQVNASATLTLAPAAVLTINQNVTLAAGSALTQGATSELYIGQDLFHNGATLTLDPTSEVGFGLGAVSHTIGGSTGLTLQILTVGERASGGVADLLHLAVPVRVARKLELANGAQVDNTTGSLTLLSTPTATALIVQDATSSVTSPATIQRALNTTNAGLGYRQYSSPVLNNSLNDLTTATFTPVFDAAYNRRATAHPAAGFPTVFGYDQARIASTASPYTGFDKGWFSPDARGAVPNFQPGQGYAVNLSGTELVDFVGVPRTGDQGLNLRRAAGSTGGEGLHLVGNPYPAPIDWSLVVPGDRLNLDAAFYVFESSSQYGGAYRSAVNGVGASSYIGMGQGFFVRVTPGQTGGRLTFKDTHRLTDETLNVPVRRGAADVRPLVQLTLAGAGASDDVYVYAQAGATPGADAAFDAAKLPNPTGLNLASLTATGEALAIDGRAGFGTATIIPLQVAVPAAGSYTFTAAALAHLAGTRAELVDNLTGTRTVLTVGAAYRFATATTTAPGRFFLNLAPAAAPLARAAATALAAQVLTYPNPTTGRLTVVRPAGTAASAVLLNALGQTVRTLQLPTAETALDLRGLATGVYTLRLTLDGQPVSKRVVLE